MKIIDKKLIIACLLVTVGFFACSDYVHQPIENTGKAPGPIEITNIENIPGGAVITYDLPGDPDVLYVMAKYTEKGIERNFKASYYTNTLVVEGLSREEEYDVELTAVNRSNLSSPVVIAKINPLTPPVMVAFASLKEAPTFGGISVSFENPSETSIAIALLTTDSLGEFYEHDTYYTSQAKGRFSVRGFEVKERAFKAFVRDRWNNTSDTVSFDPITPIGEKELDKSLFKPLVLKTDASSTEWGGQLHFIWDGRAFGDNEGEWGLHTGNEVGDGKPKTITFDLGVKATISRFKLWCLMDDKHMYDDMSPRFYEIWGRVIPIDPITDSGNINDGNWFKMCDIENVKPSGLPKGSLTDEDRESSRRGDEFVFEEEQFTTRYIRVRSIQNWGNNTNMCFSEVSLWATVIESLPQ